MHLQDTKRFAENKNKSDKSGVLGVRRQRPNIKENNQARPHIPKGTDPFTYRIHKTDLLKRPYIPSHIKPYD